MIYNKIYKLRRKIMEQPIKYAIQELTIEKEDYFTDDYIKETIGFIVSKCYVLEDRICYSESGTNHKYAVSFRYDDFESFMAYYNRFKSVYGNNVYKYYIGNISKHPNTYVVDELFDSYEEAKIIADAKNSHLKWEIVSNASSNGYDELCSSIDNILSICSEYEKFVFANTTDMEITTEKLDDTDINAEIIKKILEDLGHKDDEIDRSLSKYYLLKNSERGIVKQLKL